MRRSIVRDCFFRNSNASYNCRWLSAEVKSCLFSYKKKLQLCEGILKYDDIFQVYPLNYCVVEILVLYGVSGIHKRCFSVCPILS